MLSFTSQPRTNDLILALSNLAGYAPIKIKSRYETDFENILFETFKGIIVIEKQYIVGNYRVDWYIPKYNIIIECDENNHKYYDKLIDNRRTSYIDNVLKNPKWIRFSPELKNFNIGTVLNNLLKEISLHKQ